MTDGDVGRFTFFFAMIVTTGVLVWALKLVNRALTAVPANGTGTLPAPLIQSVLAEPPPPSPQPGQQNGQPDEETKGSFSRTAGAIGAAGMASVTIGLGYWIMYALFFSKPLPVLQDLGWYFLSGSALFFPYAFNQLARLFKS